MTKTALVFGHSSGLGLEISNQLLKDNYMVIGFSKTKSDVINENLVNIEADFSKESELDKAVKEIKDKYKKFDVLVFTAGTLTAHDMNNLNYGEMEYSYKVNTFAPMFIESQLLDLIKENGTDVVNITSSSLIDFYPKYAEYSSSKAAFAKFTSDLQKDLQGTSARVTDVCPSGFASNIYKNMTGDKIDRDESKQIKASDLAALIIYLINLPKIMEVTHVYINRK